MGRKEEERKISTVIIDTDILIWYFRGNEGARDFVAGVPYQKRMISALCVMELIQGCADKSELKSVKDFIRLNFPQVTYPDERIFEKAIGLLEHHALSDGLSIKHTAHFMSPFQSVYSMKEGKRPSPF